MPARRVRPPPAEPAANWSEIFTALWRGLHRVEEVSSRGWENVVDGREHDSWEARRRRDVFGNLRLSSSTTTTSKRCPRNTRTLSEAFFARTAPAAAPHVVISYSPRRKRLLDRNDDTPPAKRTLTRRTDDPRPLPARGHTQFVHFSPKTARRRSSGGIPARPRAREAPFFAVRARPRTCAFAGRQSNPPRPLHCNPGRHNRLSARTGWQSLTPGCTPLAACWSADGRAAPNARQWVHVLDSACVLRRGMVAHGE